MNAVAQREQVQGIEIGAGMGLGILVFAISVAFVGMNGYHMSNYLIAKLTNAETAFLTIMWWKAVGFGVAALEIPLGMSFITNYRLLEDKEKWSAGVKTQFSLAVLVALLATGAGIGSQIADAQTRNNEITSHGTTLTSYGLKAQAIEARRTKRLLGADKIKNEGSREIAKAKIEEDYLNEMSKITDLKADKQANKPIKTSEDGSWSQLFIFGLLSTVASFGAFFLSCFHATYIKQLVALIAFSLESKANHPWMSYASDFKSKQHELSPLNKDETGTLFKEKVPAQVAPEATKTSPILESPDLSRSFEATQKEDVRRDDNVHIKCPACDVTLNVKKETLLPTQGNPQGKIRCGECAHVFHGVVNIVDKPAPQVAPKATQKSAPRAPFQSGNSKPTPDPVAPIEDATPVPGTMGNTDSGISQESPIPRKFPANSSQIREGIQEVKHLRNSSGISQEFAGNSTGISDAGNSSAIPQQFDSPKASSQKPLNLSDIAEEVETENKMIALANEIDRLSSDPQFDGLLFPPTVVQKDLNVGYPPVKKVFDQKRSEGRISTTKPYKIIYKGGV